MQEHCVHLLQNTDRDKLRDTMERLTQRLFKLDETQLEEKMPDRLRYKR